MGSLNHRWTNLVTGVILEDQIEDFVNVFLSLLVGATCRIKFKVFPIIISLRVVPLYLDAYHFLYTLSFSVAFGM